MPYKDIDKRREAVRRSEKNRTAMLNARGLTSRGTPKKNADPKHFIDSVDSESRTGLCRECGPVHVIKTGPRWKCSNAAYSQVRRSQLLSKYGLTIGEYELTLESQNWCCASCSVPFDDHGKYPCVDHSHTSGKVRGIICHNCNAALGLLGDTEQGVMSLLEYIRRTGDLWRFLMFFLSILCRIRLSQTARQESSA